MFVILFLDFLVMRRALRVRPPVRSSVGRGGGNRVHGMCVRTVLGNLGEQVHNAEEIEFEAPFSQ